MANKKCDLCGKDHEPWQAHVFEKQLVVDPGGEVRTERLTATNRDATNKTKNRRSKEAYNEYQREYMRKRRKEKK